MPVGAGEKSISSLGTQEEAHAIGRRVFNEALSAKSIIKLQPILESALQKVVLRWEEYAKTGQEVEIQDDITDFTLESIAAGLFGEYATPNFMQDTKRLLPALLTGLFSFPYKFPPPLNKLPPFAFGSSMDARQEYKGVVRELIQRRRADVAAGMGASNSGGILDLFFELEKQYQMDAEEGSFFFDDDFIIDNVRAATNLSITGTSSLSLRTVLSERSRALNQCFMEFSHRFHRRPRVITILFAGKDTTSATLTRMLQLLGTAEDGKEIMDQLTDELSEAATVDNGDCEEFTAAGLPGAVLITSFPLLNAVVLEANRLHPAVGSVFRTTRKDISYNGYLIPEGETISWNLTQGSLAETLYPEPRQFCPFRFLHGGEKKDTDSAASPGTGARRSGQPIPPMWGFGKHMCPGRELAKLEMILFMKTFLPKFDFEVVEGQVRLVTTPILWA
ncbi:unnamed protein product [Ectocarpus sp. CCAP 1310/34]|nr:unnamed protein product [Ectocarpus sp. CCAP 1310/34]